MSAVDAPPSVPKRRPRVLIAAVSAVVVAVVVVIAFVLLQPRGAIVARETASPNPASAGDTVIFRYFLLNGGSVAVTVDRIESTLYHNGSFFVSVDLTSADPGWLSSTVASGQEVQVLEGTFLVTAQFVGAWLERCTFFTSAGQFVSEASYTFTL